MLGRSKSVLLALPLHRLAALVASLLRTVTLRRPRLHRRLAKVLLHRPLALVITPCHVLILAVMALILGTVVRSVILLRTLHITMVSILVVIRVGHVGIRPVILWLPLHIVIGKVIRLHVAVVSSGLIVKLTCILLMNLVAIVAGRNGMVNMAGAYRCNPMAGISCYFTGPWPCKKRLVTKAARLTYNTYVAAQSAVITTAIKAAVGQVKTKVTFAKVVTGNKIPAVRVGPVIGRKIYKRR